MRPGAPASTASPSTQTVSAAAGLWLRLFNARGIGPLLGRRLVRHFGDIRGLVGASAAELQAIDGLGPRLVQSLRTAFADDAAIAMILRQCAEEGIDILCPDDAAWPQSLNGIDDAPLVLFVRGDVPSLNHRPAIAVVGARRASQEGRKLTRSWCRLLSDAGVGIISGMAYGIDAAAHRGGLEGSSPSIAVLGCGLAALTEEQQRQVAALMRQGCVVSEFLPQTPARAEHFPRRNRIIAALGALTLVMEADIRSGSLITARQASDYGRDVLAVPGSVLARHHAGCHLLIREGAQLVDSPEQVLLSLGLEAGARSGKGSKKTYQPANETEAVLLAALAQEVRHIDVLAEICGLTMPELSPILLALELQGVIERLPGSRYMLSVELRNQ